MMMAKMTIVCLGFKIYRGVCTHLTIKRNLSFLDRLLGMHNLRNEVFHEHLFRELPQIVVLETYCRRRKGWKVLLLSTEIK